MLHAHAIQPILPPYCVPSMRKPWPSWPRRRPSEYPERPIERYVGTASQHSVSSVRPPAVPLSLVVSILAHIRSFISSFTPPGRESDSP